MQGLPEPLLLGRQKAEMEGLWRLPSGGARVLGNRFRAGGEWDHKGQIRELTGGATWLLIDSERAVRFDVFSNIHYGYLLAEAEFSEDEAQTMANLGEELPGPAEKIFGVNDASRTGWLSTSGISFNRTSPRQLRQLTFSRYLALGSTIWSGPEEPAWPPSAAADRWRRLRSSASQPSWLSAQL